MLMEKKLIVVDDLRTSLKEPVTVLSFFPALLFLFFSLVLFVFVLPTFLYF